jgi:hypothetical protein
VKAPIVLIIVVVLALAVGACSTGKPCAGPYGEPCGGPRSGWPGAVTCPPVDMRSSAGCPSRHGLVLARTDETSGFDR